MRVLVLKHGRSGGFILSKWIASKLHLHHYHEPLGEEHPFNRDNADKALHYDNVLVEETPNAIKDFGIMYEGYLNTFDKVVCLTRKDIHECAISAQSFISKDEYKQYHIINEDWLNLNEGEIYLRESELIKVKDQVLNVTNCIQVTYEDIFETKNDIPKIINYLELDRNVSIDELFLEDPAAKFLRKVRNKRFI
jgi:hypothetical protein